MLDLGNLGDQLNNLAQDTGLLPTDANNGLSNFLGDLGGTANTYFGTGTSTTSPAPTVGPVNTQTPAPQSGTPTPVNNTVTTPPSKKISPLGWAGLAFAAWLIFG